LDSDAETVDDDTEFVDKTGAIEGVAEEKDNDENVADSDERGVVVVDATTPANEVTVDEGCVVVNLGTNEADVDEEVAAVVVVCEDDVAAGSEEGVADEGGGATINSATEQVAEADSGANAVDWEEV
jgi:hypothetical protein